MAADLTLLDLHHINLLAVVVEFCALRYLKVAKLWHKMNTDSITTDIIVNQKITVVKNV